MKFKLLVTATDIAQKADLLGTRFLLPHLLRRLVQRTVPQLREYQFRTEEGTQLEGWDGIVHTNAGTSHVPDGTSGWEMGVNKKVKDKADGDYQTRKADPLDLDPAETTFVFVTPRRWSAKNKWAKGKQAEGFWKSVVAWDADDLAAWLEEAPGVHIWLSGMLGKHPGEVIDIESWWGDWAAETDPEMDQAMILAGRQETIEAIKNWLTSKAGVFSLQADTRQEAIAIFCAAVSQFPQKQREEVVNKTVIVRDIATWRELATRETGLILIPEFTDSLDSITGIVLRNGHRVMQPLDAAHLPDTQVTVATPINSNDLKRLLEAKGYKRLEAQELAQLARRSFTEFRRRFLQSPAAANPAWATAEKGPSLLPAVLAGSWEDENKGDREVVETLAGMPYEEYRKMLAKWMRSPAPPVREISGTWFVVDKAGAWERLRSLADKNMLIGLEEIVLTVLSADAPLVVPNEDEPLLIQLWNKGKRLHSPRLRQSLADTISMLGADTSSNSVADSIQVITRKLFAKANASEDARGWVALDSNIKLLAEASPTEFLSAILDDLATDKPVLAKLFNESNNGFFPKSDHTGILWALEALVWNPDYLPEAALALAGLARLDPGGALANRPKNSLRELFLLWHPQTMATVDERFAALDYLRKREPEVAWKLMLSLLPKHHDIGMENAKPRWRWREWDLPETVTITEAAYFNSITELTERIIVDAGLKPFRWASLIDHLAQWLGLVSNELKEKILSGIETLMDADLDMDQQQATHLELRDLLAHHRQFSGEDWALPENILTRLEQVYYALAPDNLLERSAWIFTQWPKLPGGRSRGARDVREHETISAQDASLNEVFTNLGPEAILQLIPLAPEPFVLGKSVIRPQWGKEFLSSWLIEYLAHPESKFDNFAEGLAYGFIQGASREEAEQFGLSQAKEWRPDQAARYFSRLPTDTRTWELVDGLGEHFTDAYWSWVWPYGIPSDNIEFAIQKFIEHHRPASAIDLLSDNIRKGGQPSMALVHNALHLLLQIGAERDRIARVDQYDLEPVVDYLDEEPDYDRQRAIDIAIALQKVFGHDKLPKILTRQFVEDPSFFVQLLTKLYQDERQIEENEAVTEEPKSSSFGLTAYEILEKWKTLPGTQPDGSINADAALSWVSEALKLAAEAGRKEACERAVGSLIGHTKEMEELWPQQAVSQLIEAVGTNEMIDSVRSTRYNIHGRAHAVTGGIRERVIAETYDQAAKKYRTAPRTAGLLRMLAATFHKMAKVEKARENLREQTEM